ncbi:hypothetical protein SCL_0911 [Sulfuricaulis limicola]|uniref:Pyrimidine deaminase n=1 Tax=Sulfuricaulis limicola TaxID=1620215 RepID=A0A1B4XEJ5_9GAMM|nr:hypothetical protein SCL_0911 [Sulfuricaulis limicola]
MGQLLRLIIILIGLWLVLTIIKRALASLQKPAPDKPAVTKMVACAHCGMHIPESEAVRDGNRHYCSEEHRRKMHT